MTDKVSKNIAYKFDISNLAYLYNTLVQLKDRLNGRFSLLVRSLDNRWNLILPSLYLMQSKLANLGVVLVNDEVAYYSSQEDYNALV